MTNNEEIPIRVWIYKRRKRKRIRLLIYLLLLIVLLFWSVNYLAGKHEDMSKISTTYIK